MSQSNNESSSSRPFFSEPLLLPVLLGFLAIYLCCYVRTTFFTMGAMEFPVTIPIARHVGVDFEAMLNYSRAWAVQHTTPYIGENLYPPAANALFAPLLVFGFATAYKIVTILTILCYAIPAFFLTSRARGRATVSASAALVAVAGFFSYGMQFELERGQFNIIAVFFALLAVWIFHRTRHRMLAYVLFCVAVQLKVYPLIFLIMLVRDWRDWKKDFLAAVALGIANFALFFVLGRKIFSDFLAAISAQTLHPYIGFENHSARCFVTMLTIHHPWTYRPVFIATLVLIAICVAANIVIVWRRKKRGIDPYLLLACAAGALTIPSVSHDYTLPVIAAPLAYFLWSLATSRQESNRRPRWWECAIIFVLAAAYSTTLFAGYYKPVFIRNNFPALMLMLCLVTVLALFSRGNREAEEIGD